MFLNRINIVVLGNLLWYKMNNTIQDIRNIIHAGVITHYPNMDYLPIKGWCYCLHNSLRKSAGYR